MQDTSKFLKMISLLVRQLLRSAGMSCGLWGNVLGLFHARPRPQSTEALSRVGAGGGVHMARARAHQRTASNLGDEASGSTLARGKTWEAATSAATRRLVEQAVV